jgi:hypothetical protein
MLHRWHRGQHRKIKPGQRIHASVAFWPEEYYPKTWSFKGKLEAVKPKRPSRQSEAAEISKYIQVLFGLPNVMIEMDQAYIQNLKVE